MCRRFRGLHAFAGCCALAAAVAAAQPASGPEFRVNTTALLDQGGAGVAEDSTGRFVVAWLGQGNYVGYQIWMQRYAASGLPLGAETRVNTNTLGVKLQPVRVAALAGGGFVVVWNRGPNVLELDVYAQQYDGALNPVGGEFRVNTYTTGDQESPSVAADGAGNFVVVWTSSGQDPHNAVLGQRFSSAGTPVGPEFRVSAYTTAAQLAPSVVRGFTGGFVVAWSSKGRAEDPDGIFARRYDPSGAPLGGIFRVNTVTTGAQESPSVAADVSGNFVIAWQTDEYVTHEAVIGQRYSATGSPAGGPFRVNAYTTANAGRAAVTRRNGDFLIAWDDGLDVFARRYDASGTSIAGPFRVNTYTTDIQNTASISSRPDGGFVIVWSSNLQDGSGYGVYGQKYCLGGDADGNGVVDVVDVFYLINYLFAGGPEPKGCADVDGSLTLDVSDVFYLINHLFAGGPPPV
jgi:hypothetical protein